MPGNALRILVIEDDPITVAILKVLIEAEGHSVCGVAVDRKETMQELASKAPDIVFMDLRLKDGANGTELTRYITQHVKIPVIIISGASDEDVLTGVSESGALSFIQKPIGVVPLRMNLRIALYHHALLQSVAESEERYRNIFNNAAVGMYICHPDGHYLTCNQAFASMLGYANPQDVLSTLVSQDEQLYEVSGRRQTLLNLLRNVGEASNFESKVFGRDGSTLWISEHCKPFFDEKGNFLHYEGIVMDITTRKQAEDDFQTTFNLMRSTINSLPEGVLVTDLQGHLIMANSAATTMLGQTLEEGKILDLLNLEESSSPYSRFLQDFSVQAGVAAVGEAKDKLIAYDIVPYVNAESVTVGAIHVIKTVS